MRPQRSTGRAARSASRRVVVAGWLAITLVLIARTAAPLARGGAEPQAAETGWLIVAGPPDRRSRCALTRAYGLETGAAFVHDACAGRAVAGSLPPEVVRDITAQLVARRADPGSPAARVLGHTWRWVAADGSSVIGDLPWPEPGAPGNGDTTLRQFVAAENRLAAGCAPPLPPPSQVLAATLPRMASLVSADASQELTVRYRAAREAWTRLTACPPG